MSVIEFAAENKTLLTVTEGAAKQMRFLRDRKGTPEMSIRVGVKGGGCSGLSYTLALDSETRAQDIVIDAGGINVVVDPKCAKFLQGTVLDYSVKNLLEGGWVFNNPNASRTCGCGTSFQPKV